MKLVSPIAFQSNVYRLDPKMVRLRMKDKGFLSQIHTRKAVKVLQDRIKSGNIQSWEYELSEQQKAIYNNMVKHRVHCELPDYLPWGVILIDGKEKVVCKCNRKNCLGYKYCAPYIVAPLDVRNNLPHQVNSRKQREEEKLIQRLEELCNWYNPNTPPDEHKIGDEEGNIAKEECEAQKVNNWLENAVELGNKRKFELYNLALDEKEQWLDTLSLITEAVVKSRNILAKYKDTLQNIKNSHRNWLVDEKTFLSNIPKHLSSVLSEKLNNLIALDEKHKNEYQKYLTLEEKCTVLLNRIEKLLNSAEDNEQNIHLLEKVQITPPSAAKNIKPTDTSTFEPAPSVQPADSFKKVEQEIFVHMPIDSKVLINSGPGRGKTHSIVDRIMYLVKEEHIDPIDITVLCFSRSAVAEVRSRINQICESEWALKGANWQIGTIDSYSYMLTHSDEEAISKVFKANSYEEAIQESIDYLHQGNKVLPEKYIIIDEVQDVLNVRARFILELLKHLDTGCGYALLGDFCQAIFDFTNKNNTYRGDQLTSDMFFEELINVPQIVKYEFVHNYRSNADSDLNQKLDTLRPALMKRDAKSAFRQIVGIRTSNNLSSSTLENTIEMVCRNSQYKQGTSGVLVWKNAEVTDIASKFYDYLFTHGMSLPVHIQRRKEEACLAGWIGLFFRNYDKTYIDKDTFVESFESLFTDEIKQRLNILFPVSYYWDAMEQCMNNDELSSNSRYEVTKMLKNIALKAWSFRENCGALLSGFLPNSSIVISNIHQAKGREYDHVFLNENLLDINQSKNRDPIISENCRVAYVALTRSKGDVNIFNTPNKRYSSYRNRGYCARKKLKQIEFGLSGDLDPRGFANEDMQDYIFEEMPIGEQVQLQICKQRINNETSYELAINGGDPDVPDVLGTVSERFKLDLFNIMMQVNNMDFPKTIENLYVNDIVTFIEKDNRQGEGLTKFGDIVIWNGLSVIGMGECTYTY